MSTVTAKTKYTPEDLLTMPDGDNYELVDGNLVERNMGAWSSYVAGRMLVVLHGFCEAHRLGWVFPADASYLCFPGAPGKVRRPDASFIRLGRLPGEEAPQGHILIAPDLAVEVMSPNDMAYEVDEKVEEYLKAGVRLIWVVNPEARTVRVYRADGSGVILRAENELSGEDVLPGFRCQIAELFQNPAAPSSPP
jgi:Uma2 family endonuclease